VNKVVQNYPATDGDQYVALRQRNALEGLFNQYGVDVGACSLTTLTLTLAMLLLPRYV
jgi:hypothetical protein